MLFRFGQRCGEAKVKVHANAEVSLADQVKELNACIKQLERKINILEDEKSAISMELHTSKEYWKQVWEPRTLIPQEKINCKLCVQNLFASAKESIALSLSVSNQKDDAQSPTKNTILDKNSNKNQDINNDNNNDNDNNLFQIDHQKEDTDKNNNSHASSTIITSQAPSSSSEVDSLIERSQEELYVAVEKMDRAVLIELSIALGGLVQTMYLEREKAKAEDQRRMQRKARIIAEKEARLKAKFEAEAAEKVIILFLFTFIINYSSIFIYEKNLRNSLNFTVITFFKL